MSEESDTLAAQFNGENNQPKPKVFADKQQQQNWTESITSASTPPNQGFQTKVSTLPASWGTTRGPALPPRDSTKKPAPGFTVLSPTPNTYDKVIPANTQTDQDKHVYLQVYPKDPSVDDINTRLQKIQETQTALSKEFIDFKRDITTEILSLKLTTENLFTLVQETSTKLQTTMDKLHFQQLENSDHLGRQILDVRRDIVAANKRQLSISSNSQTLRTHIHCFEWELLNFDTFAKSHKDSHGQFYHIPEIDYRVFGRAVSTKDNRFRLKISGEFSQSSKSAVQKLTKFECSVCLVDKSGKQAEWLAGKIFGEFCNGNEWIVGDVATSDVKNKGYVSRTGNVCLKFVLEICL